MEITRDVALKVRDTVAAGLVAGIGEPMPGQMCVEAAVCYALGLPHSDRPPCVSPAVRSLKVTLNDEAWTTPWARAKGLARLALAQLGSAGAVDDREFARRVAEMTIRVFVPVALRAAATCHPKHAGALEVAAVKCEQEGTGASATYAASATADYAPSAASSANYAACAARRASRAESSAQSVASAASSAAYAAYAAAYAAKAHDGILADFAERVVQILVEMGAPGAQWLDLSPLEER